MKLIIFKNKGYLLYYFCPFYLNVLEQLTLQMCVLVASLKLTFLGMISIIRQMMRTIVPRLTVLLPAKSFARDDKLAVSLHTHKTGVIVGSRQQIRVAGMSKLMYQEKVLR